MLQYLMQPQDIFPPAPCACGSPGVAPEAGGWGKSHCTVHTTSVLSSCYCKYRNSEDQIKGTFGDNNGIVLHVFINIYVESTHWPCCNKDDLFVCLFIPLLTSQSTFFSFCVLFIDSTRQTCGSNTDTLPLGIHVPHVVDMCLYLRDSESPRSAFPISGFPFVSHDEH